MNFMGINYYYSNFVSFLPFLVSSFLRSKVARFQKLKSAQIPSFQNFKFPKLPVPHFIFGKILIPHSICSRNCWTELRDFPMPVLSDFPMHEIQHFHFSNLQKPPFSKQNIFPKMVWVFPYIFSRNLVFSNPPIRVPMGVPIIQKSWKSRVSGSPIIKSKSY